MAVIAPNYGVAATLWKASLSFERSLQLRLVLQYICMRYGLSCVKFFAFYAYSC